LIYDITYSKQVSDLSPPHKRKSKVLAFLNALVYPIQWLRDVFFLIYKMGSISPRYNSANTYSKKDRVIYTDKSVYEALSNVAAFVKPNSNPDIWLKISNNFIGADQRVKFRSSIMILQGDANPADSTYGTANQNGALNKWFGVNTAPWIYLTNNATDTNGFFLGWDSDSSSQMAQTSNYQLDFLGESYTVTDQDDFIVNIPSAVYTSINADPIIAEAIVRGFLDPIIVAGIKYSILPY
jgi:hypothetical protein